MAYNEDGDLIDLGNDACVPRVTADDSTPDEQEHLLDVCPPKLEQKLSLTRRQERVLDSADKGDILVTLGHDQVMPIRKRIDVVSSDTIKRVRDITRNLEPVIRKPRSDVNERAQRDVVDYATISEREEPMAKHEDETYEAREISSAFNFLTEHDDNLDQAETSFGRPRNENVDLNRSISSMRPLIEEEDTANYRSESSSRATWNEEVTGRDHADTREDVVTPNGYDVQLDNIAFESSPDSGKFQERSSIGPVSVDSEPHTRASLKRRGQEDVAFKRKSKRRSFQEPHRKSWTEGTSLSSALTNGLGSVDRSTSFQEYRCAPPIPDVDYGVSSFLTRYDCFQYIFMLLLRVISIASSR